ARERPISPLVSGPNHEDQMTDGPTAPAGFLSPAVQRLASESGIDLRTIQGTGAGGRITARDVKNATAGHGDVVISRVPPVEHGTAPSSTADPVADRRISFSAIRLRAAQNLRQSINTAVHALVVTEVDFSEVDRARTVAANDQTPLTYLPFVARAVIDAIRRYPEVNAVVDGDALVVRGAINLGFAVDLDHAGLVVPVVHDADRLRLTTIAERIA